MLTKTTQTQFSVIPYRKMTAKAARNERDSTCMSTFPSFSLRWCVFALSSRNELEPNRFPKESKRILAATNPTEGAHRALRQAVLRIWVSLLGLSMQRQSSDSQESGSKSSKMQSGQLVAFSSSHSLWIDSANSEPQQS